MKKFLLGTKITLPYYLSSLSKNGLASPMNVSCRESDNFKIIDVNENVSSENAVELENLLNELIDNGSHRIVINFLQVEYLCSYTISVLVRAWQKLVIVNGVICIFAKHPEVMQLLTESNINRIMPVHGSEESFTKEMATKTTHQAHLRIRTRGQYTIIDILRPISIVSGYDELDTKIDSLITEDRKYIAFNLAMVDRIYSEMAGLLNKWSRQVRNAGGNFCLVGLNPELQQQLTLIGFDKFMRFCDTEFEIE